MAIRETQQQSARPLCSGYADNKLLLFTLQSGLALVENAAMISRHTKNSTANHRTSKYDFFISWTF